MAAAAQLLLGRLLAVGLRRPWERPDPARPLPPGRAGRGFANIRPRLGTPARVAKPTRPGPGRPKGSASGPATPIPGTEKAATQTKQARQPTGKR